MRCAFHEIAIMKRKERMNKELICREDLKKHKVYVEERHEYVVSVYNIDNAPTVNSYTTKDLEDAYIRGKESGRKERPTGEWIDYSDDGFVECPACGRATTCDGNKDELHFCWNCGARMGKRVKE